MCVSIVKFLLHELSSKFTTTVDVDIHRTIKSGDPSAAEFIESSQCSAVTYCLQVEEHITVIYYHQDICLFVPNLVLHYIRGNQKRLRWPQVEAKPQSFDVAMAFYQSPNNG